MSSLQALTVFVFGLAYCATIFSAIAADIADRRDGYWHGSASNWRLIALVNLAAVGIASMSLFVRAA